MQNDVSNDFTASSVPLLPYYVYVLLNPMRNNQVFYVGKGTGSRGLSHLADAKRQIRDGNGNGNLSHKSKTIQELLDNKCEPRCVVVGRYETEDEAYAVEATLIHLIYGHENLANVANGRGSRFIRNKQDFEKLAAQSTEEFYTPGIDIPMKRTVNDGSFRDEKVLGLSQAGAYDYLAEIGSALTKESFRWRAFDRPGDKRFHPGESNGYLALIVTLGTIDFNIQFTKYKIIKIQFIYTHPPSEESVARDLRKLADKGITIGKEKAGGKYSWLEPRNELKDIKALINYLCLLRKIIENPSDQSN